MCSTCERGTIAEQKKVSAQDVADHAGVSRTTVSFVLNNTPGKSISEDTRQRVLRAASELGYIPNEDARRLAMMRTSAIGVFIGHSQYLYSDVFISRVVEGMAQTVNKHRIQLVIQPVGAGDSSYLELARQDEVEGIILINTREDDPALEEVIETGFPAVSIDYLEGRTVPQVYVDNRGAAREMVEFLIGWGHRRIAMITHAPPVFSASMRRLEGYHEALAANGLESRSEWVRYGDFSEASGYAAMVEVLNGPAVPTAVFVGNDVVAYGAIQAVKDLGLRIPEDLSLCGFDDDYLSRYLNPPLTTMALPATGMGSAAVTALLEQLDPKGSRRPRDVVLPTHISIRNSCCKLEEMR